MLKRGMVFLIFLLSAFLVSAACSPPASGDWNLSSGTEACVNQTVVINGDVHFNETATLSLFNTNFTINSSTPLDFQMNFYDDAVFNATSSHIYMVDDTFNMFWFDSASLIFTSTNVTDGTNIFMQNSSVSTFNRVNLSGDVNCRDTSSCTLLNVIMAKFDNGGGVTRLDMVGASTVTITDSTINGQVGFGSSTGSTTATVSGSSFTNDTEFRGASTYVNFATLSTIAHVDIYANTPTVNGSITFLETAPDIIIPTNYRRHYPIYVRNQYTTPIANAGVNITNSSGHRFFTGVTDNNGFLSAGMSFNNTYCGVDALQCDDEFTISTNSSETLGIQTNTPIYLTQNQPAIPEFSTIMLLLVAGFLGGLFVVRKYK